MAYSAELAQLFTNYSDPARAYHNWSHIGAMLELLEETHDLLQRPRAVLLAILFHDVVYDPRADDNEDASAEFMHRVATDEDQYDLIGADVLISFTRTHEVGVQFAADIRNDGRYFLDMDLSILGAEPPEFRTYCNQIRQEFHFVPDEEYLAGRIRVLERFLDRSSIFFSTWGQRRFEQRARINLVMELERLRA